MALQCGCSPENIRCQIVLDKILYDADRRLLDLIILRGLLADELDCFLQCKLPDRLFEIEVIGNQIQVRGLLIQIQDNLRHLLPPLVTSGPGADPDLIDMLKDLVDYADKVRDKLEEEINGKDLCEVPIKGKILNICTEINTIIGPDPDFRKPADFQGMTIYSGSPKLEKGISYETA